MRALCILGIVATLLTAPLAADTYSLTKTTFQGQEMISAEYLKGKNVRFENRGTVGQPTMNIQNFDQKAMYLLDPRSKKYTEIRTGSSFILSLAQLIARPPRVYESGKTVNIYYETIDTGEQKQFLGQTARHLVIRERHVAEPGACEGTGTHETERDGWYIQGKGLGYMRYEMRAGSSSVVCRDTIVKHGEAISPGFPVLEKQGSGTREVLELSSAPLDNSLFEAPSGFEKVEALPGIPSMSSSQRFNWEWTQLDRAFRSWFQ